jgi:hypothetical protein
MMNETTRLNLGKLFFLDFLCSYIFTWHAGLRDRIHLKSGRVLLLMAAVPEERGAPMGAATEAEMS